MEKEKKMSAKAATNLLKKKLMKTADRCVSINQNINDEYELVQVFISPDNKSVELLLRDLRNDIHISAYLDNVDPLDMEVIVRLTTDAIANKAPCDRQIAVAIYRNDKRHIVSTYFDYKKKNAGEILGLGLAQILDNVKDFETFFHIASAVFEKMAEDLPREKAKKFICEYLDNYYDAKKETKPEELVIRIKNTKYKS